MWFYELNFAMAAILNILLLLLTCRKSNTEAQATFKLPLVLKDERPTAGQLERRFLLAYAFAVGADWLQGAHLYAVYKNEKRLSEEKVALLYATGFASAACSSFFAGRLGDRHGRKKACLAYCTFQFLGCASMFSDRAYVLYMGRVSGGFATTLLFSVFDAWMISAHHGLHLATDELCMTTIFRNMALVNGSIAICSGLISDLLVKRGGSGLLPFAAGQVSCLAAFVAIWLLWDENYGVPATQPSSVSTKSVVYNSTDRSKLVVLSLAICFFEGAMYLFIFFWSASLTRTAEQHNPQAQLPLGLIFASFMSFMMTGSSLCSLFLQSRRKETASQALVCVMLSASMCLSFATLAQTEYLLFWVFCSLETCVGAYFLAIGCLKSQLTTDASRGQMNSVLRIPLNIFVVTVHGFAKEGDSHRYDVFLAVSALLLLGSILVLKTIPG